MIAPRSAPLSLAALAAGAALAASGCGSRVGSPCTLSGGTGQGEVLYERGSEACGGEVCMALEGGAPYCTTPCEADSDCPDGFACQEVDLSPSPGVEDLVQLCVDETPPDDAGDDDTVPAGCTEGVWGTAPVLSNLVVGSTLEGGVCSVRIEVDWADAEGDLNGADSLITIGEVEADGVLEIQDATAAHLTFTVPIDGKVIRFGTAYDVSVRIRDRGCNWSNEVKAQGYVTPQDASCQ